MKLKFADSFKGKTIGVQIGHERFEFNRDKAPFEVSEAVGNFCLKKPGLFVLSEDEVPATAPEIKAAGFSMITGVREAKPKG